MNKWLSWRLVFLRTRGVPITIITCVGVAVGVAALMITLSIIDGFADAYRDGLVRFNAPIVVMREDEQVDATVVDRVAKTYAADPSMSSAASVRILKRANTMRDLWWWGNWRYHQVAWAMREWPIIGAWLDDISPQAMVIDTDFPTWIAAKRDTYHDRIRTLTKHGITATSPFLYREGLLIGQGSIRGVALRGVDPQRAMQVNTMQLHLQAPGMRFEDALRYAPGKPIPMVLGSALAKQLGTDTVQLYLPSTDGQSEEGQTIDVRIAGTFTSGLYEYDSQFAFLPLRAMQALYSAKHLLTGYEIQLDDMSKAPWMAGLLQSALGPGYVVRDWRETHRETFEAVALEKVLFGLIMGILVLVAAANIITAMLLRILARYRTVAVLHAVGLSCKVTQRIFFRQGALLGSLGVIAGIAIGSLLSWSLGQYQWITIDPEIYFLSHVPTHLSWSTTIGVGCFGLGICWWAASRAARRVADLPILEALGRGYL